MDASTSSRVIVSPDQMRAYIRAADRLVYNIKNPRYLLLRPVDSPGRTPLYFHRLGVLLEGLAVGDHTVLDFGAGTCWVSLILNKMGARTIALDVSKEALRLGKQLFRDDPYTNWKLKPQFKIFDGFALPLDDASVDRIICFDAFHHVPNVDAVLQEFHRVLREGGRVGMSEPGAMHAEALTAEHDRDEHGVVEEAVRPLPLARAAREAGFDEVFFKPYPAPETIQVPDSEYDAWVTADARQIPAEVRKRDENLLTHAFLQKGEYIPDTRKPHDLRARLEHVEGPTDVRRGRRFYHIVHCENIGDTTWLANDPLNAFVQLEADLFDGAGNKVKGNVVRERLSHDVRSREAVRLNFLVRAPLRTGVYELRYDMRIAGRFRFADPSLNPWESHIVKVPLTVK